MPEHPRINSSFEWDSITRLDSPVDIDDPKLGQTILLPVEETSNLIETKVVGFKKTEDGEFVVVEAIDDEGTPHRFAFRKEKIKAEHRENTLIQFAYTSFQQAQTRKDIAEIANRVRARCRHMSGDLPYNPLSARKVAGASINPADGSAYHFLLFKDDKGVYDIEVTETADNQQAS